MAGGAGARGGLDIGMELRPDKGRGAMTHVTGIVGRKMVVGLALGGDTVAGLADRKSVV